MKNTNVTIEVKQNWKTISTFNYKLTTRKALKSYVAFLCKVWGVANPTIIIHGTSFCQPPIIQL